MTLRDAAIEVSLLILDLLVLRLHNIDLRVEHELIAHDSQFLLIELFDLTIVVSAHLLILLLKQGDVLETRLFVIKEGADAGLFLIIYDFFFQDLELKLHEVNLLLEI
jgi:hypothetical protein